MSHPIMIKEFYDTLNYPIYYLSINSFDERTRFSYRKSFDSIPFQYSLHIEHRNGTIEHKEFMSDGTSNFKFELAKRLCEDISLEGTVLTNSYHYKQSLFDELSTLCFQYCYHLLLLKENLRDITRMMDSQVSSLNLNKADFTLIQNNPKNRIIKKIFLEYCKADTLMMVASFKKVREDSKDKEIEKK